ncbi:MAG: Asp-tRNA(Asn)/Glu-tRNA(Gln) amidotransferase subunit GatB [Planctomycetota bacterium]|nr:Asp-tRNA(Asn)/Glu-tRNA(Gln) amidotransferase subunit GatB [Planctomycetota bacterium]
MTEAMLTDKSLTDTYELVVGLEVHSQLLTKTKLFCACELQFGAPSNTKVCPVCLGLPGSLPVMNKKAFEHCLRIALAFGCTIPEFTYSDRKNYYYPDLPKNYQISQDYCCLGTDGQLELIKTGKHIRIHNIHIEEDAGKLIHPEGSNNASSFVDLNRAGTPLAEIVTMPDFRNLNEIEDYMETLRSLLLYLEASDCKMQEGSLRFEASISVRKRGMETLGKRSEIKNLNSFKAVLKAVQFEYARQIALIENGGEPSQETRLWNENFDASQDRYQEQWAEDLARPAGSRNAEAVPLEKVISILPSDFKGRTRVMRSKEQSADYRYFPEPDLLPIPVSEEWKREIQATLPELPGALMKAYTDKSGPYRLKAYHSEILVKDKELNRYFRALTDLGVKASAAANYAINQILGLIGSKDNKIGSAGDCPITPSDIHALDAALGSGVVTKSMATGKVFLELVNERLSGKNRSVQKIIEDGGFGAQRDEGAIRKACEEAIEKNSKAIEDLKKGKKKARGALIGFVMKQTRGKAPAPLVNQILDELLKPILES